MSAQDTREFLEDLLLRYDAGIDLSEGSRAQTEIIEPVLERIGIDPIDEETGVFIVQRIQQAFPDLAISAADDITDILIDPARVLLEPLIREVKLLRLRGSLRNSELMSEDEVDALFANFFQSRRVGAFSRGVVRAYFSSPQTISISQVNLASTRGGLRYIPARPQQITAEQMLFNTEGSEYYFDINYIAERQGDEYNVEPGEIRAINGLPAATRVTNLRRFRDGAPRETTAEFEARVGASISDKTLTVARGVIRTLTDAFGSLRHTYVVGYRDPEMQRDIIKGGGLGPIPNPDTLGPFFGTGQPVDDLDGDLLTSTFEASAGFFVSRLAAVGQDPQSWYLSLVYQDGGLQVRDVRIVEVLSDSTVRLEIELPVSLAPGSITWALRQRKLTLSDVPGGIVFPDTAEGTLDLPDDQIHIGGRTDVYVAGGSDTETALLSGISDAEPRARGRSAATTATNVVTITDAGFDISTIEVDMSLVLEEGADIGSYRILQVLPPNQVRIDTEMTGTQNDLSWRIVDEIDVELTDPKDIKAVGSDVVTVAGNPNIVTLSGLNFRDVNVVDGDILELRGDPALEGDYLITEVGAVTLTVSPAPSRSVPGVAFRIFRRSEPVQAPIIRIRSMELVDSAGAPVGTSIPYRDPVLAVSNGFGNEGAGLLFDDRVITGLVLGGVRPALGETYGGGMYFWGVYDPDALWLGPTAGEFLINVAPGSYSAAALSAIINADPDIIAQEITTVVLSDQGYDFVAFVTGPKLVRFGAISSNWGIGGGYSSACVRAFPSATDFVSAGISSGDLLEIYQGNSAPLQTRTLISPVEELLAGFVSVGQGPIGPRTTAPTGSPLLRLAGLYNNTVLNPDINAKARVARPSVGSARTYFLSPTSAEFDPLETVFTSADGLSYRPDPENTRVLLPPVPSKELPSTGMADESGSDYLIQDTERNFLQLGIRPGDLIDLLYQPIISSAPLPGVGVLNVLGLVLRLRLRGAPYVTVSFATNLARQEVVDFVNERVGENVASLLGTGELRLRLEDGLLELDENSSILDPLGGDPLLLVGQPTSTEYSQAGTYIIRTVGDVTLTLSPMTAMEPTGPSVTYPQPDIQYRIRRHVQRISSTEMRDNIDATGMYYADVELIATAPGDRHNIGSGEALEVSGHRGDGYRLRTENAVLSYSRAETLWGEFSRTILLPGSTDSPEEYVQLSRQNVLVTYDRSSLVDEIQSFVDSDSERVTTQDLLVRHLRPHYVNIAWAYVGGSNEPEVIRALQEALDDIAPGEELEVSGLVQVLTSRGASSVYSPDPSSRLGRREPVLVAVYHDESRRVRAAIITDVGQSTRLARWIADRITPRRLSVSGLR